MYEIKPLKWIEQGDRLTARVIGGEYTIYSRRDGQFVLFHTANPGVSILADSAENAKTKAQDNWNRLLGDYLA